MSPLSGELVEAADFPAVEAGADCNNQCSRQSAGTDQEAGGNLRYRRQKPAQWERGFNAFAERLGESPSEKGQRISVLVNFHQQAFVRWLGYNVIGVFTPDEMSPAKMAELADWVQIWSSTITTTRRERASQPSPMFLMCSLANFPGEELDSLMALMEDNA